jgi:phosphoglycerate dehydrogenase-like enzyme
MATPGVSDSDNLINATRLAMMKQSAVIVNIGRGNCVDEEALITALENDQIAFAALDTTVKEPVPEDSPLYDMKNVLLTQHQAYDSEDLDSKAAEVFAKNFNLFLNDQPLMYEVNRDLGY